MYERLAHLDRASASGAEGGGVDSRISRKKNIKIGLPEMSVTDKATLCYF